MSIVGGSVLSRYMAASLGDLSKSVWFVSSITIVNLSTILPMSQAADYWGRKPIILAATAGGAIGCIIISRATDMAVTIFAFVVLGTACGCQAALYSVPSEVLPRKYRPLAQAATNMAAGLGCIIGVLLACGLLNDNHVQNYRIFWYVNTGFFVLGFLGVFFGYNPPPRELQLSLTFTEKLRRMDWIGGFLISGSLALFAVALQWSGNPYTWSNGHVLGPFIIGVCGLVAFAIYEWKATSTGLLHHGLFGDRNFPLAVLAVTLEGLAFFTTNAYFVFEISLVNNTQLFQAGLPIITLFCISLLANLLAGLYSSWTRKIREPIVLGFALLVIFNALMASYKHGPAPAYGYAVVAGAGIGVILSSIMVTAQLGTPKELISITSGIITAFRALGGTIGLAIDNAIVNNTLKSQLGTKVAAAVVPSGFPPQELVQLIPALLSGNPEAVASIPGMTPLLALKAGQATIEAYTIAFRNAWIAGAAFGALGLIGTIYVFCVGHERNSITNNCVGAILIRNPKEQFNNKVDAPDKPHLHRIELFSISHN